MAKAKQTAEVETQVIALQTGRVSVCLIGITPFTFNAVSFKSASTLLIPPAKKTAAEKLGSLKHDPIAEYRASVYAHRDDDHAARLFFPGYGFKGALKSAALRMPGLRKSEIAQLTWVMDEAVDIFGVPEIFLAQVRSADISRTPDIRTRAKLRSWAARLSVTYVRPQLSDRAVINLIAAAGLLCGVGDGRQERGYGGGQFEICDPNDPKFLAIIKAGGRKAQDEALANPTPYDIESEQLLSHFEAEVSRRGDAIRRVA
jgi:hypothetical protein